MIQWKYLTSNDKSSTTNKPSVCTRQNLPLKPSVSKRNSTTQHPLPDTSPFHDRINSRLKIDTITVPLVPSNAITLLKDYDIILESLSSKTTISSSTAPTTHQHDTSSATQQSTSVNPSSAVEQNDTAAKYVYTTLVTMVRAIDVDIRPQLLLQVVVNRLEFWG